MNEDSKIRLDVKSETGEVKLSAGRSFVELCDNTSATFLTKSLKAFILFLCQVAEHAMADGAARIRSAIYYSAHKLVALQYNPGCNTYPAAICDLEIHEIVDSMITIVEKEAKLSLDQMVVLIRKLVYMTGQADLHTFLWRLENFKLSKVTAIERSKDQGGNFKFLVQRSAGQDDVEWPKELSFSCPMFSSASDDYYVDIRVAPYFSFSENDGDFQAWFTLVNPLLKQQVEEKILKSIETALANIVVLYDAHCGTVNVNKCTDAWRFKEQAEI